MHVVAPSTRVENGQRKRPKYTRSKTGCMTCRGKKIKVRSLSASSILHQLMFFSASVTRQSPTVCDVPMASERFVLSRFFLMLLRNQQHTQCTWPEGVPTRKRSATRKTREPVDITRPSTAGSSGLSEHSTPPTRDATPKREAVELSLPPQPSRRATSVSFCILLYLRLNADYLVSRY